MSAFSRLDRSVTDRRLPVVMPRPWPTRLLRACLALWFALAGAELGMVHACPQHGGAGGHQHSESSAQAAAGTHGMSHGAHASVPAAGATSGTDRSPAAPHACTCVGACAAASGAAALAPSHTVPPTATISAADVAIHGDARDASGGRSAHVLPFGNGPPAGALTA
ncbi:MAG: hypothetical protein JWN79_2164 [Gemmatimonadetes bacterium]|jgi:hypothetical protein|nr:hypothetical protein [Gemmatimonadota bacterium]